MVMWQALEVLLTGKLLASPTFHRLIRSIHKRVAEIRAGEKLYHPEDFSNLDLHNKPDGSKFLKYYVEELRDQFKGTTKK